MPTNSLEFAKQGDPQAIATLMNHALASQGVTVQAALRRGCLHILMESEKALEPSRIVPALRKAMQDLQSPVINRVRVYGHQKAGSVSIWSQVIDLNEDVSQPLPITQPHLGNGFEDEPPTAIRAALVRSADGSRTLKTFDQNSQSFDQHQPFSGTSATSVLISPASLLPLPVTAAPAAQSQTPDPQEDLGRTEEDQKPEESQIQAGLNGELPLPEVVDAQPQAEVLAESLETGPETMAASPGISTSPYEHPTLHKTQAAHIAPTRKPPLQKQRKIAIATWGVLGAFACGIGFGGWLLWGKPLVKTVPTSKGIEDIVQQIPKIEEAKSVEDLESQAEQIQSRLEELIKLPATADVQKQVGLLQGRIGQIKQRLGNEFQASNNLVMAERLSQEAEVALTKQPQVEAVNTAKQKLQSAIRLLEVSPVKTFHTADLQKALTQYQDRVAQMQSPVSQAKPSPGKIVPTPQAQVAPTPKPSTSASKRGPVQLSLAVTGQSWLQVTSDGKILFEGIVDKGIQQNWRAKSELIVRVGSAGFITASFNGTAPKPLGETGDVLEFKYSPKGVTSRRMK